MQIYRLLGFLPSFLQAICFCIYCIGLQEILIKDQIQENGELLEFYKKVKLITEIFSILYATGYIAVFIIDILMKDSIGKNLYFLYRIIMGAIIVLIVLWSSFKVRNSLEKYKKLFEKATSRVILMCACLFIHFSLKILTSILFINNTLDTLKCDAYKDSMNWYYIGYLSMYQIFNEWLPCVVIIFLMIFHEEENKNTFKKDSQTVKDTIKKIEENADNYRKMKEDLMNYNNEIPSDEV